MLVQRKQSSGSIQIADVYVRWGTKLTYKGLRSLDVLLSRIRDEIDNAANDNNDRGILEHYGHLVEWRLRQRSSPLQLILDVDLAQFENTPDARKAL